MWFIFAILSAIFAALTSILAKIGIEGVNSNLATAVRTIVVVLMAWFMVFITGNQNGIVDINKKSWIFLILSGLATGASWLCYYKALQLGEASKVVPIDKLSIVITIVLAFIFLGEQITLKTLIGCCLIVTGTFIEPTQFPDGIEYVLVNGKFAVKEGKSTYELGGKVIRIER